MAKGICALALQRLLAMNARAKIQSHASMPFAVALDPEHLPEASTIAYHHTALMTGTVRPLPPAHSLTSAAPPVQTGACI